MSRTPQDVQNVADSSTALAFPDWINAELCHLIALLSSSEVGFLLSYALCVEIERGRFEDLEKAMEYLASWLQGQDLPPDQATELRKSLSVSPVRTFSSLVRTKTPFPREARGQVAEKALDLYKIVPLEVAVELCAQRTTLGLHWLSYKEFRRLLHRRARSRGAMTGYIVPGAGDRALFVTRKADVARARRVLPSHETDDAHWASRLRDLLGLWGLDMLDFPEMVAIQYHPNETRNHDPRTPTLLDASCRKEFIPCCRHDGWGRTVDGRETPLGLKEAMVYNTLGGQCFLAPIGEPGASGASVSMGFLLDRLRTEYANCVS